MADIVRINTGEIRLQVECNGKQSDIAFNPNDINFVESLYVVFGELENKQKELQEKEAELLKNKDVDKYGFPVNLKEKIKLMKETCGYMRQQVDSVFGVGTSQKIFGDTNTLDMFEQFFEAVTPYVQHARDSKMQKYKKDMSRNVMS